MSTSHLRFLLAAAIGFAAIQAFATSSVPVPQVTGPIAAPDIPGTPSHNYIFFASNHDLAAHGYVEEEFFIKGTAKTYNIPPDQTDRHGKDSGQPYLHAHRGAPPRRSQTLQRHRAGGMGQCHQPVRCRECLVLRLGTHDARRLCLGRRLGPDHRRRGAEKMEPATLWRAGCRRDGRRHRSSGGPDRDAMSYDIFSQVGEALRHPGSVDMLHGLKPKLFLAIGESQSAARLATYVNAIQPRPGSMTVSCCCRRWASASAAISSAPVIKVNTEYDVLAGEATVRQPDTAKFRTWEVAGTSHVDQHLRASREPLELRDNGVSLEANMAPLCAVPQIGTRVPTSYVVASAFDKLAIWAAGGPPPPSAPVSRSPRSTRGQPRRCRARSPTAWRKAASGCRNSRCPPRSMSAEQACAYRIRALGRSDRRGRLCPLGLFGSI